MWYLYCFSRIARVLKCVNNGGKGVRTLPRHRRLLSLLVYPRYRQITSQAGETSCNHNQNTREKEGNLFFIRSSYSITSKWSAWILITDYNLTRKLIPKGITFSNSIFNYLCYFWFYWWRDIRWGKKLRNFQIEAIRDFYFLPGVQFSLSWHIRTVGCAL